ncbi:hypothetical protein MRB53_041005 [Persea americana]|nr:hypothetical protein MRB53_041005 [Persea americana]
MKPLKLILSPSSSPSSRRGTANQHTARRPRRRSLRTRDGEKRDERAAPPTTPPRQGTTVTCGMMDGMIVEPWFVAAEATS